MDDCAARLMLVMSYPIGKRARDLTFFFVYSRVVLRAASASWNDPQDHLQSLILELVPVIATCLSSHHLLSIEIGKSARDILVCLPPSEIRLLPHGRLCGEAGAGDILPNGKESTRLDLLLLLIVRCFILVSSSIKHQAAQSRYLLHIRSCFSRALILYISWWRTSQTMLANVSSSIYFI
jgi:hypothetical protein